MLLVVKGKELFQTISDRADNQTSVIKPLILNDLADKDINNKKEH